MIWPHLVRYTDALPEGVGGEARGPVVRIRSCYRNDEGIHAHELEHVRQWWTLGLAVATVIAVAVVAADYPEALAAAAIGLATHSIAYVASRRYRYWAEARAYREQMRHPDAQGGSLTLDDAASRLAGPRYDLGIDVAQARARLQSL